MSRERKNVRPPKWTKTYAELCSIKSAIASARAELCTVERFATDIDDNEMLGQVRFWRLGLEGTSKRIADLLSLIEVRRG